MMLIGKIVKLRSVSVRVGLAVFIVVICVTMMLPGSRVQEVHNIDRISNFALVDPRPTSDDWPWAGGTDSRNVSAASRIPLDWSSGDLDGWRIDTATNGAGSPIVWGDHVFLIGSNDGTQPVSLHSYHRSTGRMNWRTELHHSRFDESPEQHGVIGATPACDGQFVYVTAAVSNSVWVTAVDLKGRIAWQHEAGPYWSKSGYRSSPMLFRSLVIVVADQENGSYLTALHRQTGEIIWRVRRPNGHSFSTPVVATIAGRSQLIVGGQSSIISYDPATGERIWMFRSSSRQVSNTLTFDDQHVYAAGHQPNSEIVCIKADGVGDVSKSHLVWRQSKIACGRAAPVCHKGLLYLLSDHGSLACLNAATGTMEWQKGLAGIFSVSPVIAGDDLICGSESGRTFIVRTGNSGTVIAENYLEDEITGSPAVVGNSIFLRTRRGLHRISSSVDPETVVEKPDLRKRRI